VKFWLDWAIGQFNLEGVVVDQFDLTGVELCQLSHDDFTQLVPNDIDNIFWTHLELLRKCKFVGQCAGCDQISRIELSLSENNHFSYKKGIWNAVSFFFVFAGWQCHQNLSCL